MAAPLCNNSDDWQDNPFNNSTKIVDFLLSPLAFGLGINFLLLPSSEEGFRPPLSPIDNAHREGVKCWVFRPSTAANDASSRLLGPPFSMPSAQRDRVV